MNLTVRGPDGSRNGAAPVPPISPALPSYAFTLSTRTAGNPVIAG